MTETLLRLQSDDLFHGKLTPESIRAAIDKEACELPENMNDKDLAKTLADLGAFAAEVNHTSRHKLLHDHLDELMADYFLHHPKKTPSSTTLTELMQWSYKQTLEPESV